MSELARIIMHEFRVIGQEARLNRDLGSLDRRGRYPRARQAIVLAETKQNGTKNREAETRRRAMTSVAIHVEWSLAKRDAQVVGSTRLDTPKTERIESESISVNNSLAKRELRRWSPSSIRSLALTG